MHHGWPRCRTPYPLINTRNLGSPLPQWKAYLALGRLICPAQRGKSCAIQGGTILGGGTDRLSHMGHGTREHGREEGWGAPAPYIVQSRGFDSRW